MGGRTRSRGNDVESGRAKTALVAPDGEAMRLVCFHHGDDPGFKAVPFEGDETPAANAR